jgi:hypothetical protein
VTKEEGVAICMHSAVIKEVGVERHPPKMALSMICEWDKGACVGKCAVTVFEGIDRSLELATVHMAHVSGHLYLR